MVVRLFTEAFAVGIPRYTVILYQYGGGSQFYNEPWTNLSLTDHASVPYEFKPSYWTYQQMTQMVKGWTSVSDLTARTSTEDRDVFRIRFVVAGDPVDVYWCDADTVFDAPVTTAYAKVTHILTRAGQTPADALIDYRTASGGSVALPVGPDPVYVQGVAQNPVGIGAPGDLAGVLRAEPSPARGTVIVSWRGAPMTRPVAGTLALYGVNGRQLSTRAVAASMWQAGFALELRDTNGRPVHPGLYWIAARLADGRQATARFVVVR